MKKTISALMSLLLIISVLAGCGGGAGEPTAAPAPTADAPSQETAAPESTPVGESGGDGPAYEQLSLMLATTYNEAETVGQSIKFFTDYITEKSDGAVKFNIKWGGTVAGTGEELSFLQSGAFDMSVLGQSQYSDVFPLLNFPGQTDGSQSKCMEYFNYIVYENAETSALIQAQIEAQGVKMLGYTAAGGSAFAAKSEMTTLDELKKNKLGIGMNHSAYESLGFTVQAMMPWDAYDNLSKGVVDIAYMAMGPMVALNWHEVAPYFISTSIYSAGNYFTLSLDKWNSMSADTQALFNEAMTATEAYSVEINAEQEANVASVLESAGGALLSLDEAGVAAHYEALFKVGVVDCRALAQSANCSDAMETILAACGEHLGLPLE